MEWNLHIHIHAMHTHVPVVVAGVAGVVAARRGCHMGWVAPYLHLHV